ncbi:hypothetical protein [Vitreimonas sp.]|uniref:hypothetical protein n=1 Tax=Vitreimonas sp. TaxID=3069702 RepID=UPI002ED86686
MFALLLAATWIMHLGAIRDHGASYTYLELAMFTVSLVAGSFLAIQSWGPAATNFVVGSIGAVLSATMLHIAFDWFLFSASWNASWAVHASGVVIANLLGALTVYAPIFLALLAGAAWISHRLSVWHFGVFALAGSAAMIVPYFAWGIDIDSLALAWWPFRAADVAFGAVAGVAFWHLARPTKSAPPVSA